MQHNNVEAFLILGTEIGRERIFFSGWRYYTCKGLVFSLYCNSMNVWIERSDCGVLLLG